MYRGVLTISDMARIMISDFHEAEIEAIRRLVASEKECRYDVIAEGFQTSIDMIKFIVDNKEPIEKEDELAY